MALNRCHRRSKTAIFHAYGLFAGSSPKIDMQTRMVSASPFDRLRKQRRYLTFFARLGTSRYVLLTIVRERGCLLTNARFHSDLQFCRNQPLFCAPDAPVEWNHNRPHWTKMPRSKVSYLIIISGFILAVIPTLAGYLFSGTVAFAGDIVLEDGTPPNILERPLWRLILLASAMASHLTCVLY